MLPASLCAKIMVFRRITRIIEVVLNERAVSDYCFALRVTYQVQCRLNIALLQKRELPSYFACYLTAKTKLSIIEKDSSSALHHFHHQPSSCILTTSATHRSDRILQQSMQVRRQSLLSIAPHSCRQPVRFRLRCLSFTSCLISSRHPTM